MAIRAFDLIAFDGDDTLWHNERSYRDGRERFRQLLSAAGVELTNDEIESAVNRTELTNLEYFGYGVSSFALSLIETAIELTGGAVSGAALQAIPELARSMIAEDVELFDGVRDVLAALSATHPLMLITKGDLLHQRSKVDRSGLAGCFTWVEVVSHKTKQTYETILNRHRIEPARFLMVGNSLRSDILPVVEAGGRAVYVPAALSWSHEHAELSADARARVVEVASIHRVPDLVRQLDQNVTLTAS
jgi:putative hydrolase of the HAD superfamily